MLPLDLELLILSYTSFGEFITFYESDSLETKIKACYKELPNTYDVIKNGDLVGTKYLLKSDTSKIKYFIYRAIDYGHMHIIDYLVNIDINIDDYHFIPYAIRSERIEILSYLIQKYNYIFNDYDFKVAVETKNLDLLKWVIKKYPHKFDWIAELALSDYPELEIFKFAVSIGIKLTNMELITADYYKHTEIAKYIESQL